MQSPPFSRYLVPPRSKYSPQHLVLKHPQLPYLPQCQRPSFTPIQKNRQNYKKVYYNNKLANSSNKPKTTWSIIKTITNNKMNSNNILMMENDGKFTTHYQTIVKKFNHY